MTSTTTESDSAPLPDDVDIDHLRGTVRRPIDLQKIGLLTRAGVMEKITFTATIREIAERFNFQRLLARHHFDIDSSQPGNRDITESHWKEIEDFLLEDERPFLGTIVVAMRRDPAFVEIENLGAAGECVDLAKMTIYGGAEKPIIEDGQHRNMGAIAAWNTVRELDEETATPEELKLRSRLAESSVTIEMLFEHERDVLSTIFVKLGKTKQIPPALVAVMDRSAIQNRLGTDVMNKSDLFRHRTTYLGAKAGKELATSRGRDYESLYTADAVRNAAANLAGVGVRDRTPKQREDLLDTIVKERMQIGQLSEDAVIDAIGSEIAATIDYAFRTLPGWREVHNGRLTVNEFKDLYVHGTAAGLYTIVTVLAAAKAAGVSTQLATDVMAKVIPWRRNALRDGRDTNGLPCKVHDFFEGTLVQTAQDKDGEWKAGTMGARRDMYQSAAEKVLRAIAKEDSALRPIAEHRTFVKLGLASAGRGRPKKTSPPTA
jgi:hypothetical protein